MKKALILIFFVSFLLGCEEEPIINSNPIDLSSCFSPEFGITEEEQMFYNLQSGELHINIDGNITTQNLGYAIQDGSNTVFIYRHLLENNFNIIDDEVEVRILFEVDDDLNSFDISSIQDFEKANMIYSECGIALQSISGTIKGNKRSDGNWMVKANIVVQRFGQTREVRINEVYTF